MLAQTTVGFGDVVPVTPTGRFVVALEMAAAVTVIPFEIAALSNAFADARDSASQLGDAAITCPRCGLVGHLEADANFCRRCGERLPRRGKTRRK